MIQQLGVLKDLDSTLIDETVDHAQFELGVKMPIFSIGPVTLTQTLVETIQSAEDNDNLSKFSLVNGMISPSS